MLSRTRAEKGARGTRTTTNKVFRLCYDAGGSREAKRWMAETSRGGQKGGPEGPGRNSDDKGEKETKRKKKKSKGQKKRQPQREREREEEAHQRCLMVWSELSQARRGQSEGGCRQWAKTIRGQEKATMNLSGHAHTEDTAQGGPRETRPGKKKETKRSQSG